jgi:tetratricopeptide (TPR) repeat protein
MRAVLVLLSGVVIAGAADTPANWKGEKVVGKKWPKDIKFGDIVDGKQVYFEFRGIYPITVREDRDGWLRIFDGHKEGWADKDDFLLSRDATAYFTTRINANAQDEFAWFHRGTAWRDRGEHENALKDFSECVRINSNSSANYNARGTAHSGLKNYDYTEAIRLNSRYALAFNNRGLAWQENQDHDNAIQDYNEAIRLDPNNALAFRNRGGAWREKYDFDKAVKDYNEAIRLDPKYVRAFYGRSVVKLSDRRDGAAADCRRVLELEGPTGSLGVYAVIVGHLAARFAKDDAAAKEFLGHAGKLKADWPKPVVDHLAGTIDAVALLKLADTDDKRTEARCFLGLKLIADGKADVAEPHLEWVRDHGTKGYVQYGMAVAELKRLAK